MSVENTHFGAKKIEELLKGCRSVYFIGVGGINMSSLALITLKRGYRVGGSDRQRSPLTDRLASDGIEIFYDHRADNLDGYDAVVYTVAISEDNPEYIRAAECEKPLISRADYLGYVMSDYCHRIGVCGMHGKSTVTSMISQIFIGAEYDPTVMCGASIPVIGGAYRIGGGDDFIFEACEYMDSFLDFYPNIAVILNIEPEHMDYFKDLGHILASFRKFSDICGINGVTVANADDDNVQIALEGTSTPVFTFGIERDADARAVNITHKNGYYTFDVIINGNFYCHTTLSVVGKFNIYNALAALSVAYLRGINGKTASVRLQEFKGAERRMEKKGRLFGADVYSDYAHHPTEIRATLQSAAEMTKGRVFCVFQPHTYSRVYAFLDSMCEALALADRVLMIDIYPARETDTKGMSSALIAERIGNKATYCASYDRATDILHSELGPDDTLIIMGAGSIISYFDCLELDS